MTTATDIAPPNLLGCLFHRHECDKGWAHHYEDEYSRHFEPIRHRDLAILEIGVGGYARPNRGGEGLKAWRDYFPNARIVGLDIHPKTLDLGERVTIVRGHQADAKLLGDVEKRHGPFDVVIDDGSHDRRDIIVAFFCLFQTMNPGGIYAIEDVGAACRRRVRTRPLKFLDELTNLIAHPESVASVHLAGELAIIRKAE